MGCGTICSFHVGGTPDDSESCRARWEFFIGDHPHCAALGLDKSSTERQPMAQIASIEHFLDSGEVAISSEVAQQVLLPSFCMHARFLSATVPGVSRLNFAHILHLLLRREAPCWSSREHLQFSGVGARDMGPAATLLVRPQAAFVPGAR